MEHLCVDARFYFWDGKYGFTVHFAYALDMWFVFKGQEHTDAVFKKKIKPRSGNIDRYSAEEILYEYLQSKNK